MENNDIVALQFKETLEDGIIFHILQDKGEGTERYKIDMTYNAFKSLLQRAYEFSIKHSELIET